MFVPCAHTLADQRSYVVGLPSPGALRLDVRSCRASSVFDARFRRLRPSRSWATASLWRNSSSPRSSGRYARLSNATSSKKHSLNQATPVNLDERRIVDARRSSCRAQDVSPVASARSDRCGRIRMTVGVFRVAGPDIFWPVTRTPSPSRSAPVRQLVEVLSGVRFPRPRQTKLVAREKNLGQESASSAPGAVDGSRRTDEPGVPRRMVDHRRRTPHCVVVTPPSRGTSRSAVAPRPPYSRGQCRPAQADRRGIILYQRRNERDLVGPATLAPSPGLFPPSRVLYFASSPIFPLHSGTAPVGSGLRRSPSAIEKKKFLYARGAVAPRPPISTIFPNRLTSGKSKNPAGASTPRSVSRDLFRVRGVSSALHFARCGLCRRCCSEHCKPCF